MKEGYTKNQPMTVIIVWNVI